MGFGYLLIGYILAFVFTLSNIYFFADIIGGIVMMLGLIRLSRHGTNFERALWSSMAYVLLVLARAVLLLTRVIETESFITTAFAVGIAAVSLVLQFFILAGIYYITIPLQLDKEALRAKRQIGCIIGYYGLYVVTLFFAPQLGPIGNLLGLAVTLFGLIVIVLNVWLIYCCYCSICLPGQEKGERQQTRFAWLNRWNEKTDAMFDGAFLRVKSERRSKKKKDADAEPRVEEPGYMRVKRKKKTRRK